MVRKGIVGRDLDMATRNHRQKKNLMTAVVILIAAKNVGGFDEEPLLAESERCIY